jgi:hypothetical protein
VGVEQFRESAGELAGPDDADSEHGWTPWS